MNTTGQPLVSIIIPVYNSYAYFEACIQSVLRQTYSNIEIILINDGCTDNTPEIIEKYAALDSRIVVMNKSNEGVQYARRDGLRLCHGVYIQNLDCDDTLFPDAIARLVELAERSNVDMIASAFVFCPENGVSFPSTPMVEGRFSGCDFLKQIYLRQSYWPSWTLFHRHSIYQDHSLQVDPNIMLTEDTVLTTQLCLLADDVLVNRQPTVNFRVRNTSLSNRKSISDERFFNDLRYYPEWIKNFLESQNLYDSFKPEIGFLKIRNMFESISKNRLEYLDADIRNSISILKEYPELKKHLFRRERKVLRICKVNRCLGKLNIYRYKKQQKL